MALQLSAQNLISCLQDKDNYKGVQVYLQEVGKFNEQVYPIINTALTSILLGNNTNLMAKLFTLRLFKQILMTANFSIIDEIDQKIEDHIIEVAKYNKKSKEVSRGANYFIETEKVKKDAQSQKIGTSYVLLATEIIVVFAKWYPKDQEGQQTRFVQYYQQLANAGVTFPAENKYNFFKKEEEQKFKKNYSRWVKSLEINTKHEVIEKRQEKEQVKKYDKEQIIKQQKSTRENQKQQIIEKAIETQNVEGQSRGNTGNISQKIQNILQTVPNTQIAPNSIIKVTDKIQPTILSQVNEQNLLAIQKELQQARQKYSKMQLDMSQIQKDKEVELQNFKRQLLKYQQETKALHQSLFIYQNKVDKVQAMKKQNQEIFKEKIQILQCENQILQESVLEAQRKAQLAEAQRNHTAVLHDSINQSLVITDQPKKNSSKMIDAQISTIKQQFAQNRKSKSIKKTETLHQKCKSSYLQTANYNGNTASNFGLRHTQSGHQKQKLIKTSMSFNKNSNEQHTIATVYPFIQNYFPAVSKQCLKFKQYCLKIEDFSKPYFIGSSFNVYVHPITSRKIIIAVLNRTSMDQKIKLHSAHPSFVIEGKCKTTAPMMAAQFEIIVNGIDLNLRYPQIQVMMGNRKISILSTASSNEQVQKIPIPITLFNFISFTACKINNWNDSEKTIKIVSNKFIMNSKLSCLKICLPDLTSEFLDRKTLHKGFAQLNKIEIGIQIYELGRELTLAFTCQEQSAICISLGKVLIQLLMFLLQQ